MGSIFQRVLRATGQLCASVAFVAAFWGFQSFAHILDQIARGV